MRAMILAAGLGTRLLPHTRHLPKPLFPVIGVTLLDRAIETVMQGNPTRIVVNVHHLADRIEEHLTTHDYGVEVVTSREPEILGTAGGIGAARKWLMDDETVVFNADTLFAPDIPTLIEAHREKGAVATLVVRENPAPDRYGSLRLGDDRRITGYLSATSPDGDETHREVMFTGLSIISPALFDLLPDGTPGDISRDVYAPMVERGGPLYGFRSEAKWRDLGTVEEYRSAVMEALADADLTPATVWAELRRIRLTPPVYIAPGATVEEKAELGPHVAVHVDAFVGAGARVAESVVLPGGRVEPGDEITGAVVGPE